MSVAAYGSEQEKLTESLLRRIFLRVAGTYDLGARIRNAALERELALLSPPRSVLDAGSGRGELAFSIARRWPAARIVGLDYDRVLVDHATQLRYMLFPSHDISFFTAELPTDISSLFDLVVSIDVLEHIDDDAGFVRSLYNATTVGGTLILHTPAIAQRRFLAEFEDHHEHVREGYSASNLTALLSEAGYNDVRIRPTFGKLGAIAWEGFALARRGNALAAATLPICYALGAIDSLRIPPTGNGLLATARR